MSPRDGVRRAARASASIGALVAAALLPKCPLCVAAVLSALGIGASVSASVAPALRPLGIAVAVLALVLFARGEWRRRRQQHACARACGRP